MKKNIRKLLYLWLVISIILLLISFLNVRNSGEEVTFILWAYFTGAFVWEDLFVFSIYNILATFMILLIKDNRFVLVFPLSFWFLRCIGEMNYFLLQQFNQPAQYPHNMYDWNRNEILRVIFGDLSDQKYFIIYQITQLVMSVFAIVGFVYVLKNWERIGKKINS